MAGILVPLLLIGAGGYAYYEFVYKRQRAQVAADGQEPLLAQVRPPAS